VRVLAKPWEEGVELPSWPDNAVRHADMNCKALPVNQTMFAGMRPACFSLDPSSYSHFYRKTSSQAPGAPCLGLQKRIPESIVYFSYPPVSGRVGWYLPIDKEPP